ncbi:MAG TPA: hypothetical protein VEW69_00130 [Alphaproteobacteria bacterium]|nr:hypothetical protein [Alphaproteobacteria bacterium]
MRRLFFSRFGLFAMVISCLSLSAGQNLSDRASHNRASQAGSAGPQANQQQARAIIDKMIQVLGGEAYMTAQDLKSEVRFGSFQHGSVTATALFRRYWQWPDKERVEFPSGSGAVSGYAASWPFQTQKTADAALILLHNGDKGYEKTSRGIRPQAPEQLRRHLQARDHSLAVVLRQWLQAPGVALFYDGPTIAENRAAEKVTIMNARNQAVTLLIAADTHLPIKKVYIVRDPVSRDHDEEVEVYDNWKIVQGIATPYNILLMHNGEMAGQQYVLSISYNNRLEPALFEPGPNADR